MHKGFAPAGGWPAGVSIRSNQQFEGHAGPPDGQPTIRSLKPHSGKETSQAESREVNPAAR
jgi:hypothetical protein